MKNVLIFHKDKARQLLETLIFHILVHRIDNIHTCVFLLVIICERKARERVGEGRRRISQKGFLVELPAG